MDLSIGNKWINACSRFTRSNGGGTWCGDFIGFSSTGQIIAAGWNGSLVEIIGPLLPTNAWTHIVYTYSKTNGVRLYINGTLKNATGSMRYSASNEVNLLTLANPLQGNNGSLCATQSIVPYAYSGHIDEFQVYSRELNTTDISQLANP